MWMFFTEGVATPSVGAVPVTVTVGRRDLDFLSEDIPSDYEVQLQQDPSLEKTKTSARDAVRIPTIATSGIGSAKPSSSWSSETTESATDVAILAVTISSWQFRSIAFSAHDRNLVNTLLEIATLVAGACRHPNPGAIAGRWERETDGLRGRERREEGGERVRGIFEILSYNLF
ncbi:hypothetical protein TIFTF001_026316 [Ficus carica]|uniref:Uncharacterized protein n=1 Tax=Ficus carica TaxID=3494 RepID=A0AA88DLE2_FICCA|nr:hypothetical protein TIFTF001_026316 [Ficus carica]